MNGVLNKQNDKVNKDLLAWFIIFLVVSSLMLLWVMESNRWNYCPRIEMECVGRFVTDTLRGCKKLVDVCLIAGYIYIYIYIGSLAFVIGGVLLQYFILGKKNILYFLIKFLVVIALVLIFVFCFIFLPNVESAPGYLLKTFNNFWMFCFSTYSFTLMITLSVSGIIASFFPNVDRVYNLKVKNIYFGAYCSLVLSLTYFLLYH